ncbi:unnamed protein product [Lota lota]
MAVSLPPPSLSFLSMSAFSNPHLDIRFLYWSLIISLFLYVFNALAVTLEWSSGRALHHQIGGAVSKNLFDFLLSLTRFCFYVNRPICLTEFSSEFSPVE